MSESKDIMTLLALTIIGAITQTVVFVILYLAKSSQLTGAISLGLLLATIIIILTPMYKCPEE